MSLFKKEETNADIIIRLTPELKEFAEKHNLDVIGVDISKYSFEKKEIEVKFQMKGS